MNNADAVMTLLKHNANRDAQDNKVRNGCRCKVIKGYGEEGWCVCVRAHAYVHGCVRLDIYQLLF